MNIIPITPNPDGPYRQIQSGWPAGIPIIFSTIREDYWTN